MYASNTYTYIIPIPDPAGAPAAEPAPTMRPVFGS